MAELPSTLLPYLIGNSQSQHVQFTPINSTTIEVHGSHEMGISLFRQFIMSLGSTRLSIMYTLAPRVSTIDPPQPYGLRLSYCSEPQRVPYQNPGYASDSDDSD
jgi:hypothetical protein